MLPNAPDNRHQPPLPINTSLCDLLELVNEVKDPWLLFLSVTFYYSPLGPHLALRKALFLSRLARREEAIESVLRSIAGYPWNWSAWTLLASCIADGEEVRTGSVRLLLVTYYCPCSSLLFFHCCHPVPITQ